MKRSTTKTAGVIDIPSGAAAGALWTVGHSTRPILEFLDLLSRHGIAALVDVRTVPKSRRNPQYEISALAAALRGRGIAYRHEPALGGLRKPRRDSVNTAWRNASFRGYADYMETEEFSEALARLEHEARGGRTAILCAEAVPWRCHRSLVADALAARGAEVRHIVGAGDALPHRITPWASVRSGRVIYGAADR